jgi:hypothetical protein
MLISATESKLGSDAEYALHLHQGLSMLMASTFAFDPEISAPARAPFNAGQFAKERSNNFSVNWSV